VKEEQMDTQKTPAVERLMERLAEVTTELGVGPGVGRIVAYMLVCEPAAQDAEAVAAAAGVDPAETMGTLEGLVGMQLLDRVPVPGRTRAGYALKPLEAMMDLRVAMLRRLNQALGEGMAGLGGEARERVGRVRDLYDRLETEIPRLMAREPVRARSVRDVMTAVPLVAAATSTLAAVARKMVAADAGLIPLVENGHVVGVVTDRDIAIRAVAAGVDPTRAQASEIASTPVIAIGPDEPLSAARTLMERHRVRRLLVQDGANLIGVVALGDLAECVADTAEAVLVEVSKSEKTLAHGRSQP
jgi:CBS domain-containing protein